MDNFKTRFKILGQNIKSVREQQRISIKELSLYTGINERYLHKIENGKAIRITTSQFFKIAKALNILPSDLAKGI